MFGKIVSITLFFLVIGRIQAASQNASQSTVEEVLSTHLKDKHPECASKVNSTVVDCGVDMLSKFNNINLSPNGMGLPTLSIKPVNLHNQSSDQVGCCQRWFLLDCIPRKMLLEPGCSTAKSDIDNAIRQIDSQENKRFYCDRNKIDCSSGGLEKISISLTVFVVILAFGALLRQHEH